VRIQVGAFHTAAAAEKAWALLSGQVAGLGQVDHAVVQAGAVYRLQARLPDARSADDFCGRLRDAGWKHFARKGAIRA
jgi:hypothetical protein